MARITPQGEASGTVPNPPATFARIYPNTTPNPAHPPLTVRYSDGTEQILSPWGAFNVQVFGAKGDGVTVFDGAITAALTTLTCATTAPFAATDVGKRITIAGAGAAGAQLTTTIATFISASQVTVVAPAGTTVAAKGVTFGTDDTAAINSAIAAAAGTYPGGVVWFPPSPTNRYLVTSTLVIGKPVTLWGQGSSFTSDIGDYTKSGGTWIVWNGTTSSNLMTVAPTAGATAIALDGFRIQGLSFDCRNGDQNQALIGLQMLSCKGFDVRDFFVMDALAVGIDLSVIQGALGESKDLARGVFEQICIRELDAAAVPIATTTSGAGTFTVAPFSTALAAAVALPAAGFVWVMSTTGYYVLVQYTGGGGTGTLTGCTVTAQDVIDAPAWVAGCNVLQALPSNACCMRLDGVTTANVNLSTFMMFQLSHGVTAGPAAMEFKNCDSIESLNIVINGGNATNDGAINRIRKPGVRLNGSNTNLTLPARNNTFRDGDVGVGGISVMGVTNAGVRLLAQASPNYFDLYQLGNGAPVPTVEGSVFFDWNPNGGLRVGSHGPASVANQAIANVLTLIVGSILAIPPQGFQLGTTFRWTFTGLQTAAAVGSCILTIRIGTTGTTADTAVMTVTFPVSTVAAATGFDMSVKLSIRTLGAAATVIGKCALLQGSAAGIGGALSASLVTPTFATFNSTTPQQFISASFVTGGAGTTVTFENAFIECVVPSNP